MASRLRMVSVVEWCALNRSLVKCTVQTFLRHDFRGLRSRHYRKTGGRTTRTCWNWWTSSLWLWLIIGCAPNYDTFEFRGQTLGSIESYVAGCGWRHSFEERLSATMLITINPLFLTRYQALLSVSSLVWPLIVNSIINYSLRIINHCHFFFMSSIAMINHLLTF